MTLKEVKDYYKSSYAFQIQTGMKHGNWYNWNKKGYIPLLSQLRLEKLTNGELKANLAE